MPSPHEPIDEPELEATRMAPRVRLPQSHRIYTFAPSESSRHVRPLTRLTDRTYW
jgi:hypothetical protein